MTTEGEAVLAERIATLIDDIAELKLGLKNLVTLDRYLPEMKAVEQKAERSVRISTWVLGLMVMVVVGGIFGWMLIVSQGPS